MTTVQDIIQADQKSWDGAIHNSFVGACCSGKVKRENFLLWLEQEQASANNMDLNKVTPQAATAKYCKVLEGWFDLPYPVLATAVWAIEYSYFKAWKESGPVIDSYKSLKERWSSAAFGELVDSLEKVANDSLKTADQADYGEAAKICHQVAALEIEFWDMTMTA